MKRTLTFLTGLVIASAALFACGGAPDRSSYPPATGTEETSTESPVARFQAEVNTEHHPCQQQLAAKPGTCYLPFYDMPTYNAPSQPINSAPGSKCTPENESQCWGQPGTELTTVCTATGDTIQDARPVRSTVWVGAIIPQPEILNQAANLPRLRHGEVVGFAPEVWLRSLSPDHVFSDLPPCEQVLINE